MVEGLGAEEEEEEQVGGPSERRPAPTVGRIRLKLSGSGEAVCHVSGPCFQAVPASGEGGVRDQPAPPPRWSGAPSAAQPSKPQLPSEHDGVPCAAPRSAARAATTQGSGARCMWTAPTAPATSAARRGTPHSPARTGSHPAMAAQLPPAPAPKQVLKGLPASPGSSLGRCSCCSLRSPPPADPPWCCHFSGEGASRAAPPALRAPPESCAPP